MQFVPEERRGRAEDRRPGEHLLNFREGRGRWLDASNEGDLQGLLDACRDDLRLVTGGDPGLNDARALLLERPAGLTLDHRLVLGLYASDGALVAALHAYRDFPTAATWFLALVLVHPAHRGRGIATGMLARVERFAASSGALEIVCIAPARNPAVRQLLRRCGFTVEKEVELPVDDGRAVRGIHLVRTLSSGATA